jgi:hypothetical protein
MNDLENDDSIFKIPNTAIATWLRMSGVEYIDTDISEFPAIHLFKNPKDGTIGRLLGDWEAGRANGNCKTYYKTYRELVTKAKGAEHHKSVLDY